MRIYTDAPRMEHFIHTYKLDAMFTDHTSLNMQLREYDKGEIILDEGDALDGIYLLVEGQARVSSSVETGKSLVLRFCHPLSLFGDLELIQHLDVQSRVQATETCTLLFIDQKAVDTKLMQDHRFLNEMLRQLAYKLHTCTIASRVNLLTSVEERLATYLISTRSPGEFGKELYTRNTSEIAAIIGTTQRHLNRLIQKFEEDGILFKQKENLHVLNWERLDEISQGVRYDWQ
ncbi:Crp/Fnr family transcriptional regulator [Paenibacillus sp. WLX1005]|uniref:Crp/Fnr family transcriptional regulator n=1 Tax=Paenibacillus sp. WLX1005 TaxID=3243766 RepID=UPI003984010B